MKITLKYKKVKPIKRWIFEIKLWKQDFSDDKHNHLF